MIRVVLPAHLRTLARVEREVLLESEAVIIQTRAPLPDGPDGVR